MTKIVMIVTVAALSVVLSSTGSAQRSQTNGNGSKNGAATTKSAAPRSKTNGVKAKVFQPSAFERLWHSFATGEQGN